MEGSVMRKVLVLLSIIGLLAAGIATDAEAAKRRKRGPKKRTVSSEINAAFENREPEAFLGLIPMGDDETDTFEGQVLSTLGGCYVGRTVAIYKTGAKNSLTHTVTDVEGLWSVGNEDPPAGNYYAIAEDERFRRKGRRYHCTAVRSENMVV
jgi:hypothetical protein